MSDVLLRSAATTPPWSQDGDSNPDLLITSQLFFRLNYPGIQPPYKTAGLKQQQAAPASKEWD